MGIASLFPGRTAKAIPVYGAGDDLVICCSAANRREGSFDFFKILAELPARRVYINTPENSFYHLGAYGLGRSIERTAAVLRAKIRREKPRRVHVLGASMGGYAALLFGGLVNADTAIAFNAGYELPVAVLGQSVIERQLARPKHLSLLPLIRRATRTRFYVCNSDHFGRDLHQAIGLANEPNVTVVLHRETHDLTELLRRVTLHDAVGMLISGRVDDLLARLGGRLLCGVDESLSGKLRGELETAFNKGDPTPDWILDTVDRLAPSTKGALVDGQQFVSID